MQQVIKILSTLLVFAASTAVLKTSAQEQGECEYRYIKQPPLADDVMCNPYTMGSLLTLKCEIQILEEDLGGRASIRWFNGSQQITSGVSGIMDSVAQSPPTISSTVTISYSKLDENRADNVTCVLDLNGENWSHSDSLELGSYDDYINYTPCVNSNVQRKDAEKCAMILSSTPDPITSSIETTSTSPMSPATELDATTTSPAYNPPLSTSSTPHTPTPTPSPFAAPKTITAPTTTDEDPSTTSPGGEGRGGGDTSPSGTLQVWIYVLVAVAAVFAMIIVILAIMCVGLCLRRSKTIDTNSLKENGQPDQFSPSNTMVSNDMYNRGDIANSHISNYNTLGERDYEVVKTVFDTKEHQDNDYHRLQRPSPPSLPNGRTGMFGSPPGKEFLSMNTLASSNGYSQAYRAGNGTRTASTLPLPPPPDLNEPPHVYGELEEAGKPSYGRNIYRSPTNSSPPDSARWCDSAAELLPPSGSGNFRVNSFDEVDHEGLYSQVNEPLASAANPLFVHSLHDIPETGPVFKDPPNPTAFPVNEYDVIPAGKYETPLSLKRKPDKNQKSRVSVKSLNYETDPNLDKSDTDTNATELDEKMTTTSFISVPDSKVSTMTSVMSDDTSDFTGASEVGFTVNGGTPNNDLFSSSTAVFPNGTTTSSLDKYRNTAASNMTTMTGVSDMSGISDTMSSSASKSTATAGHDTLPENVEVGSLQKNRSLSSTDSETRVRYPTNHQAQSSSQTGLTNQGVVTSEELNSRARSLPPFSGPVHVNHHQNGYRELNLSGLEPQFQQYSRLQIGITSTV